MKKILIASACAITLCFTACASKQAPEAEPQTEMAPQIEAEADVSEEAAEETSENATDTQSETTDTDSSTEAEETETPEEDTLTEELTSEDFPEPEAIEEPEIVTLEPEDEVVEESTSEESEPVQNEEPPEIIVIADENDETTEPATEEASESENPEDINSSEETEDISANDVVIVTNPDTDGISGGIDITNDDSDSDEQNNESEIEIIPSRSVTLKKFEYLDVTYPGSGWIYMGLTDNSKDIAYFGRKLGTKDTKFTLQARAAGTKIIHFYRNDPLTGQYLDDYIEVIIQPENGSNKTHIEAPEYKLPVKKIEKPVKQIEEQSEETESKTEAETVKPEVEKKPVEKSVPAKQAPVETKKTEPVVSLKEESEPAVQAPNSQTLLKEAQLLYNEKEYKSALSKLNQFFEFSTDNRDEALYLKGQILEEKSEVRDIKGAIDAYSTLTKNYPASKYWDSANKRIIYLKRFYLEVR